MTTYYRKYSTNVLRNAAYFGIGLLVFNIAWNGIFVSVFPDLAGQAVNEAVLGRFFAFAHLWALFGIFLSILFGIFLSKRGLISYPGPKLAASEVLEYNQKYGADFPLPKKKFLPAFGIIFSILILPGLYLALVFVFVPENTSTTLLRVMHLVFFVALCYFFYSTVLRQIRKSGDLMKSVFDHANKKLPLTELKLKNNDFAYSAGRLQIQMGLEIGGVFRGHELGISHSLTAVRHYVSTSSVSEGGVHLKLDKSLPFEFSVSENEALLNKFESENLDEAFRKRFDLKGAKVAELPDGFKKLLLESPRSVFLKVQKDLISHELANLYITPFYTGQGVVLFLDWLLTLADELR